MNCGKTEFWFLVTKVFKPKISLIHHGIMGWPNLPDNEVQKEWARFLRIVIRIYYYSIYIS